MPEVKNNNFYDMGAMSYNENVSKKLSEFTRENLYIGIPAFVTNTDHYETLQCVDVQPVVDGVYTRKNGIVLQSNIMTKVFVLLPSTGGFSIKQPIQKGDIVTLYWAHKDLGEWLDSEGKERVAQSIFKIANIEDCWCEPRGGTRKTNTKPSKTNLVIEGPNTTITITPEGNITTTTTGDISIKCNDYNIECENFNVDSTTFTHNNTNVSDTHVHSQGNDSAGDEQVDTDPPK